ncbi:transposase [Paenibacillus lautus]
MWGQRRALTLVQNRFVLSATPCRLLTFRRKETVEERHALSVQRMVEPESVFGQIKNNRGFRRFLLRGLHKVSLEVGWLSLAHNLLKKAANDHNRSHSGVGITS